MTPSKSDLFALGKYTVEQFCTLNALQVPEIQTVHPEEWRFDACAYYRPVYIAICVPKCAHVGSHGMAWSYPGYTVDRTPYGVLAHEVGHHADCSRSGTRYRYFGDYSVKLRKESGEVQISSYAPNDAEWFAEMFRVFITNPDLLRIVRPRTYALLAADFRPVVTDPWDVVLRDAPVRTFKAAAKKVKA